MTGNNIALKKPASQYSTAPQAYYRDTSTLLASQTCRTANCAVDGDTNGDWNVPKNGTNSITSTFLTPTEDADVWLFLKRNTVIWWQVDLGSNFTNLDKAVLFNRIDNAGNNLVGARIIW